jgi:hypothetical protein
MKINRKHPKGASRIAALGRQIEGYRANEAIMSYANQKDRERANRAEQWANKVLDMVRNLTGADLRPRESNLDVSSGCVQVPHKMNLNPSFISPGSPIEDLSYKVVSLNVLELAIRNNRENLSTYVELRIRRNGFGKTIAYAVSDSCFAAHNGLPMYFKEYMAEKILNGLCEKFREERGYSDGR